MLSLGVTDSDSLRSDLGTPLPNLLVTDSLPQPLPARLPHYIPDSFIPSLVPESLQDSLPRTTPLISQITLPNSSPGFLLISPSHSLPSSKTLPKLNKVLSPCEVKIRNKVSFYDTYTYPMVTKSSE